MALVDRFYDLMEQREDVGILRDMHDPDTREIREKLFLFLCGWFGGPQYYVEKYGHPRMKARHMPFKVDEEARNQWLLCMFQALEDVGVEDPLLGQLKMSFTHFAEHMRNC